MITDRLSSKELERWEAIKRLVFAIDTWGNHAHPILISLWEEIERGPHALYIEMRSPKIGISNVAGSFKIEQFDPQGIRHVAVIELNLKTIDLACIEPTVAPANGFIPLQGLRKEERYAEVLGHELAHAAWILGDLVRARKVEELVRQTNELLISQMRRGAASLSPEMRQRIIKRDILLRELEDQAEEYEFLVWREITRNCNQRNRKRNRSPLVNRRP